MPRCARALSTLTTAIALATGFAVPACPGAESAAEPVAARPAPCRIEGIEQEVPCATYPVWEDREAKRGRKIGLNVVILPALGPDPAPDPIFFFAGGPGAGAASQARGLAGLDELRRARDFVLVDQRGTGGSHPLDCAFYGEPVDLRRAAGELLPLDEVRRCRERLEKVADLRLYGTAIAMDDVDEVRGWLGYEKINLFGGSYGTRAAQVYLRRHGAHVRAAILTGVAPLDEPIPLHHAYAGQRAVDLVFAECAADPACKAAFPRPGEELRAIMERIEKGVEVEVSGLVAGEAAALESGRKLAVRPARGLVAEGVRFYLYGQDEAGNNRLPLEIHRAFEGDYAPLVETAIRQRMDLDGVLEMGMWLSVTCAEDVPYIDPAVAVRETAGTFLGDYRIRQQQAACALWPRAQAPPDVHEPLRSDVPVLLISGERDPVTPPEFGDRVARHLTNALHVVVPKGGHGAGGPCVDAAAQKLLESGSLAGIDLSCLAKVEPTKFALP